MFKFHMKGNTQRRLLLLILFTFIIWCRFSPILGEWYALSIYPYVSGVLSFLASTVPFSLDEIIVVVTIALLVVYPFIARKLKYNHRTILTNEIEIAAWFYIWFYWGWGLNYFRLSFFERTRTIPIEYQEENFKQFLSSYTNNLNSNFYPTYHLLTDTIEEYIKKQFSSLPSSYGLQKPHTYQHPKTVCFNSLYSRVGVLGYMGPFFSESQLNADLLPVQYPFTYAHELSHLLGISNEAEANFWAYYICTNSSLKEIRYSGYLGLLPYIAANAHTLLDEKEYQKWLQSIRPEIIQEQKNKQLYWQKKYSPIIGAVQNKLYDWFLKTNHITTGKKNYAEVVTMIIASEDKNIHDRAHGHHKSVLLDEE